MQKAILTKREKEIFNLLITNKTTKEIAQKLGISEKTVRNHISNVFFSIFTSSLAISAGLPNCSECTASIAVKIPICGLVMLTRKSISPGRSIPYSKRMISYGLDQKNLFRMSLANVPIKQKIFGSRFSIWKIESESPSSPLKFFGEVYIFLLGRNCCNV